MNNENNETDATNENNGIDVKHVTYATQSSPLHQLQVGSHDIDRMEIVLEPHSILF